MGGLFDVNGQDPIIEYSQELAESIEYELGLKKQNGPRFVSTKLIFFPGSNFFLHFRKNLII